jgi:RNA polymerase sigma factor (sigma-70 family)
MPRNTSVTDTRLMRRSQQGDRRAFRALLSRYDWRLRGLAHALLLDPDRVDAVLRLAYVKAWREVVRIDPRADAAAWLYRVVYNTCIDGLRRESKRIGAAPPTAADVPDVPDSAAGPPVQPMPVGGNGASSPPSYGHQTRVVEALAALAPADRVAVVLVDREGFAPVAAARILGLTPDVLAARLAGARARLTNQLADAAVAPDDEAESSADEAQAATEGVEPLAEGAQAAADEADSLAEGAEPAAEEAESLADEAEAVTEGVESLADEAEAVAEGVEPLAEGAEPAAEEAEATAEGVEPLAEGAEPAAEEAEATAEGVEPLAEGAATPSEESGVSSEKPEIMLDDTKSADPVEPKVASRSSAGGSPNGAAGAGNTNGRGSGP